MRRGRARGGERRGAGDRQESRESYYCSDALFENRDYDRVSSVALRVIIIIILLSTNIIEEEELIYTRVCFHPPGKYKLASYTPCCCF